ncbi:hypothetical protein, partial [Candidatus Ichthyocystis sparus]|uniref:hypothetical protein n=1 Tax=Candidatus Ichthyocystis sparus TaxID=1561004 RepID=UPI00159EBDB8
LGSYASVGSASSFRSMRLIKVPQKPVQNDLYAQVVKPSNHGQSLGSYASVGSASSFRSMRLIKVPQKPPQTGGFLQGAHGREPVTCSRRGDYCLVGAHGSSRVSGEEPVVVSSRGSDYCLVGAPGSSRVLREEPVVVSSRGSDYCLVGSSSSQGLRESPVLTGAGYCFPGDDGDDYQCVDDFAGGATTSSRLSAPHDYDPHDYDGVNSKDGTRKGCFSCLG